MWTKSSTTRKSEATIHRVTLADGTKMEKQMVDFKDKDTEVNNAAKQAEYEEKMDNLTGEEKAIYNLSTPIPLTNYMLKKPFCMICIGYTVMIAISIFVYSMGWIIPDIPHDREFLVWGDHYTTNLDKYMLVKEHLLTDSATEEIYL